jgi:hypothetical protein
VAAAAPDRLGVHIVYKHLHDTTFTLASDGTRLVST